MEWVFGPDDVARLYGTRLYILGKPGEEKSAAVKETENTSVAAQEPAKEEETAQPAITWMLRNDSPKVIFMISEKEFSNKPLTELLRKIVVASQVSTDDTGFGIIKGKPTPEDFNAMPAKYGFFLDDSLNPFGSSPVEQNGKKIWFAKKLGQMAKDDTYKGELWKMIKEFMQLLRSE